MIIMRSLVKDFLTKVKIETQNHQSAYKFKYETFTNHKNKASELVQKIRRYSHGVKRLTTISTSRKDSPLSTRVSREFY